MQVTFAPPKVDPAKAVIDCGPKGDLEQYALTGFEPPDPGSPDMDFTFAVGPTASLELQSDQVERDVIVGLRASPVLWQATMASQPLELWVNGFLVGALAPYLGGNQDLEIRVSAPIWNQSRRVLLLLRFPAVRSQHQLGINSDTRPFALAIRRITLRHPD